jgi:hypothetical protein
VTEQDVATLAAIAKGPDHILLVCDGQDFLVVRSISGGMLRLADGSSHEVAKFCWGQFVVAKPVSAWQRMLEPAGEDVELDIDMDDYPMF